MRIHDNRHLDFSDQLSQGDVVITNGNKYYQIILHGTRCLLVDVKEGETAADFSYDYISRMSVGSHICGNEQIKEIVKHKDLVLDLR